MRSRWRSIILFKILFLFIMINPLYGGQWINPKDAIKDPNIARLNHQKKGLTKQEIEEINRYGRTGLEIMTYLDCNAMPGRDNDYVQYIIQINSWGHITHRKAMQKQKHLFKDYKALLSYDGIKVGDIEYIYMWFNFHPPRSRGNAGVVRRYVRGEGFDKVEEGWFWNNKLRKISKSTTRSRADSYINSDVTLDDLRYREPWEENHRILGIDKFKARECFVIESLNKDSNYYLSKRVVWVEKENFLELHIEEFDKKGRLFKVIDKDWVQIKPWNYWVVQFWDTYNILTKYRTFIINYDWLFDQGFSEREFSQRVLPKESLWRRSKNPPISVNSVSDLPPIPKVKVDFWEEVKDKG